MGKGRYIALAIVKVADPGFRKQISNKTQKPDRKNQRTRQSRDGRLSRIFPKPHKEENNGASCESACEWLQHSLPSSSTLRSVTQVREEGDTHQVSLGEKV